MPLNKISVSSTILISNSASWPHVDFRIHSGYKVIQYLRSVLLCQDFNGASFSNNRLNAQHEYSSNLIKASCDYIWSLHQVRTTKLHEMLRQLEVKGQTSIKQDTSLRSILDYLPALCLEEYLSDQNQRRKISCSSGDEGTFCDFPDLL
uniref:Uncharacterized protein n=1 Tax=Micrurus lemniscatus lemniscatus TaxID=129467 RepID=A0A2D4HBM8_MICLE